MKQTYLEHLEQRLADMSDLPQSWRDAAHEEGRRVQDSVLEPRGLSERKICWSAAAAISAFR